MKQCLSAIFLFFSLTSFICQPSSKPTIIYFRTTYPGRFAGGAIKVLTISPDGVVSDVNGYPKISEQLTPAEHDNILQMFEGFDTLDTSYAPLNGGCNSAHFEHFKVETADKEKEVVLAGCETFIVDENRPEVRQLLKILYTFWNLGESIYERERPWNGVKITFKLNKLVYRLNDTIKCTAVIDNPTDSGRTLYFHHQQQLGFVIRGLGINIYPLVSEFDSTTPPSEIFIQPHEKREITTSVNLYLPKYTSKSNIQVDSLKKPGDYRFFPQLFIGRHNSFDPIIGRYANEFNPSHPIFFEIADSSCPIGGRLEYDTLRINGIRKLIFTLTIQNWTDRSINLGLQNPLGIIIQIFGGTYSNHKFPLPQLIFESKADGDGKTENQILNQGELRTFTYTFDPDTLREGTYTNGVYVKVKLASSQILFERSIYVIVDDDLYPRWK